MGKYSGTLHKLIESACNSNSKKKWDQVIFYLEGHCVSNAEAAKEPAFKSPLAPSMVPSAELERELFDQQGTKKEDTPLKIAVKSAPAIVIAALCHLGPEACGMVDSRERHPIHVACRRSSEDPETEQVLTILGRCNPESMLHRDDCGRTPLHWLVWFHAKSRSREIVRFFCQEMPYDLFLDVRQPQATGNEKYPLPEIHRPSQKMEIPQSATIVHDSCHGALPLHYAVMQGATKEVIRTLINDYPGSVAVGDRRGRSPLAWYLGAGSLTESYKTDVSGEANDPNIVPWWHTRLSVQLIQLLVSSKSARMIDRDMKRTPLHWACHFFARSSTGGSNYHNNAEVGPSISNKIFQTIVDHNIGALTFQDTNGETPLHVMFSVVAEIQNLEQQRFAANGNDRAMEPDLTIGGPTAFNPPKQLVALLLKSPDTDGQDIGYDYNEQGHPLDSAASLENKKGLLPLHTALCVAASSDCIEQLIRSHPTGLVHASEEQMQTPLIQAFSSEFSAPLQPVSTLKLLLDAYPTSRHGTFMDGRLAIKMEDTLGMHPIHYACQNQASFENIKLFVETFNRCATYQNCYNELPIHSMLSRENLFSAPQSGSIRGASLAKSLGLLTEKEEEWQKEAKQVELLKMKILLEPLKAPEHLKIASLCHGMTPLHVSIAFSIFPYERVFRMLDVYPEANCLKTTEEGHEYSCLQLHDLLRDETEDLDQWQAIRELLYSFDPVVDSHRRDEELLDACVRLIRNEILGNHSFHLSKMKEFNLKAPEIIDLSKTLSEINAPTAKSSSRMRGVRRTKAEKQNARQNEEATKEIPINASTSFASMIVSKLSGSKDQDAKKSIYDADLEGHYVVSPQQSDDELDDHSFDNLNGSNEGDISSEDDSLSDDGDMFSDTLGSDAVSQTLTQTLNYVQSGSFVSEKSLLRKAIGDKVVEESDSHEEKKEDESEQAQDCNRVFELSPVGKRLWCFFVAYNNHKDPADNYLQQVQNIFENLEFDIVGKLIDLAVPDYAVQYMKPGVLPVGLTMRDIASPKVKALFESYYYFLGRFEFSSEIDGVLLHRSSDNDTVYIRASEHVLKTTEYQPPKKYDPGMAEESIWNTGEMVHDEDGYLASEFKDNKRQVCFKFTRNENIYNNEVISRSKFGLKDGDVLPNHVLPLYCHFNASIHGRYRLDIRDERFRVLRLFGGESICLSDYPYALVYPHSDEGDLHDYSFHHGFHQENEVAGIGLQIAKALKAIHEKGVIHRNLSMRSVSMLPCNSEVQNPQRNWAITNFEGASCNTEAEFMGSISSDGSTQFQTGLLPPEMFTKISNIEQEAYRAYWENIEKIFDVQIDRTVKEPYIDETTGCSYVVRCHYEVDDKEKSKSIEFPKLPYKLVQARESVDFWCLGNLLYTLCSGGRQLFPTNLNSGHLLDYRDVVNWNIDSSRDKIYENVEDPLAQDLLLKLLSPFEERNSMTMDTIVSHPFFSPTIKSPLRDKIMNHRTAECATYLRNRTKMLTEKYEDDWITSRTVNVNCWNFDMLKTIYFSSSEIIRKIIGQSNKTPSSFILLPYKLSSKNKKGKLAPTTKADVERAERMGVLLLSLAKSLSFGSCVEKVIKKSRSNRKWDARSLIESVTFPSNSFGDLTEEFYEIAADSIEAFRMDPRSAVTKLIERRYNDIVAIFKEARKSFIYLVDEHMGVPLVGQAYAPYPIELPESNMQDNLKNILPFMHSCSMVVRGTSGGISGIVRLIFEAAYVSISS